jgi:hypothetical protein
MAERPRLKKSDEILGALPTEAARSKRPGGLSAVFDTESAAPKKQESPKNANGRNRRPAQKEGPVQPERAFTIEPEIDEPAEEIEINEGAVLPSAQTLAEKLMAHEDRRKKLNFSKYELPKPKREPAPPPPPLQPAPPPQAMQAAPPPPVPEGPPPVPVSIEPEARPAPVITEYTFQAFEAAAERPPVEFAAAAPQQEAGKRPRRPSRFVEPPLPEPPPANVAPEQPKAPDEDRDRQEFLKRIANQFEIQCEEKVVPAARPEEKPRQRPPQDILPPREPFPQPAPRAAGPLTAEQGNPAEDFFDKFRQDVRREEQRQSEDFKETLAQKFERERERYLKELDIAPPEEPLYAPEPDAAPARRKLDFQIQPEMHVAKGQQAAGPVTYTRAGSAKPQVADDAEPTGIALGAAPPAPAQPRRKTGEQLIMEHSASAKGGPMAPKLNFTFSMPEEGGKAQRPKKPKKKGQPILPENKVIRRIVLGAMAGGLVAIFLLAWSVMRFVQLPGNLFGEAGDPGAPVSGGPLPQADTLNVYNDMSYTTAPQVKNVLFKNANLTLKNVEVSDYVIIEGIESAGKIRLEDVKVASAISLRGGAVNALELHNVEAARLIVNNADAETQVIATGTTDIAVVELRTPSSVTQESVLGMGLRSMVIAPAEGGGSINAKLNGLGLQTLEASARETVLSFENDTRVDTVSAQGSMSLAGSGRVTNLSIGAWQAQGAGADPERPTLLVKDVAVTNLNVRSSANLNLTTSVENVTTASAVFIGGDGNIGAFTLNPPENGSGRLLIDIAGLNIQHMFCNAVARVNVTGSARVNNLTAGASVYALGNKVNTLNVKADGVIYENEPDRIAPVPEGIRPPQSKADNPNLDYDLGPGAASEAPVATPGEGDFATTCGHARESGGYLLGDGSRNDPYVVTDAAQLAHVALHPQSHFIQTADIDISGDSRFASGFTPIGSVAAPFLGAYDGQGYMIQGLRISSNAESVGLFAANRGQVQNVRLVSGEVVSTAESPGYVGAIVGLNTEGGAVRACSNGASVTGNANTYTGGLVGYNFGGRVHDCFNYARVTGVTHAGGLVGFNRQGATVAGCYNAGSVFGEEIIGAVAGANEGATVANCYFMESTCDFGIGEGTGTAVERTAAEMQQPQMAADLAAGNEDSLWTTGENEATGYRYPVLSRPGN